MNNAEVIYSYTQDDGINDGYFTVLDGKLTTEAGIKLPVLVTPGVHGYLDVPEELKGEQDFTGRVWDLLSMLRLAARTAPEGETMVTVTCAFLMWNKHVRFPRVSEAVKMWATIENGRFVIMLPSEY